MKRYVVDASVAIKWLIPEDYSEQALKLLENWIEEKLELHAPNLLRLEVTNALAKYADRGLISAQKAIEGFRVFREITLTYNDEDWQLIEDALMSATTINLSIYDAVYLRLAKRLSATLITADEKLISKTREEINVENVKNL